MTIRKSCATLACTLLTVALAGWADTASAAASSYPDRPLRLIVPFPPGGGNDILARAVAQQLAPVLNQQVVVDNRAGAGGVIGATIAASANPDGYTLFLGSLGSLAHNPALRPNLPYSPPRDFAAVSLLANSAFILAVHPGLSVKNVQELIALAKAKPDALNYASAGAGSSLHMTGELFKHVTGTRMVHVPFKGTGPAITDLIGGRVQLIFSTMPPAVPHVKSGKLRALAVTSAKRAEAVADVPTATESGVAGFVVENWQGLVAPAKTPRPILERLNRDTLKVLASPSTAEIFARQGLVAAGGAPSAFEKLVREEITRWTRLAKAADIRID